jgi:hypothetical protein
MLEEMLQKESLAQLRAVVEKMAARIEAPESALPTYGASEDFARPHIEIDGLYHFVVVERGHELERRTTTDLDELLFWIFDSVTFSLASGYEVRNRKPLEDSRRLLFGKQVALMAQLDERWAVRCHAGLLEVLAKHPFTDGGDQAVERVALHHPHTLH